MIFKLPRILLAATAIALFLTACTAPAESGSPAPKAKPTVRIGSTNFSEQLILAEIYGQVLEANGYTIERRHNLGNREIVAPALESGEIDLYPEYLATYVTFITKDPSQASTDPETTHRNLQQALNAKNLTVLGFAPAVDTNGFVVTQETAQRLGVRTLSELAAKANGQLVLGGPPECPSREFCLQGLERVYGLTFRDFQALDAGGPITVAALEANQIDVAVLFTTDAVIDARSFVLLEDDKQLQLADNVAPVVRNEILQQAGDEFRSLLDNVSQRITTEELTALNKRVGIDREDPREVAASWLKEQGLVN